jgi:para-nitrobenzyl esterase
VKTILKTTVGLVLCLMPILAVHGQAPKSPRVNIDSGTLAGALVPSTDKTVMFLGIPYAEAPTGDRRWRPPQLVSKWQGVRKADAFAPACPQSSAAVARYTTAAHEYATAFSFYNDLHFDEDCLYLNVLTTNLTGTSKLPVMFWIHGGGNVEGSGALPPFAPSLAGKGVVLVSIDYRLGVLGLLAHPSLTAESPHHASGNYAILDQIAALQWIQRNIAVFGGDPNNVTIFGSSAGGVYTCFLMVSPLAQGLFRRVIAESGGCRDYLSPELHRATRFEQGSGNAEQIGIRFAHALGVADGPNVLQKLRSKTPEEIQEAVERDPSVNFNSDVTIDGWVFTEQPAVTFSEGRQAHVPVLVGSNADEYTVLFDEGHDPKSLDQYHAWLKSEFWDDPDKIFAAYPATRDEDVRSVFLSIATDYNFGNPAHLVAQDTARAGQKAFLYYFSYPAKGPNAQFGAHHGNEIKFLTGMFRKSMGGSPDAEDLKFTEIVSGYWVQFAKAGDPNRSGLPLWPAYDPRTDLCLDLGHEIRVRPIPHGDRYVLFEQSLRARLAGAAIN